MRQRPKSARPSPSVLSRCAPYAAAPPAKQALSTLAAGEIGRRWARGLHATPLSFLHFVTVCVLLLVQSNTLRLEQCAVRVVQILAALLSVRRARVVPAPAELREQLAGVGESRTSAIVFSIRGERSLPDEMVDPFMMEG